LNIHNTNGTLPNGPEPRTQRLLNRAGSLLDGKTEQRVKPSRIKVLVWFSCQAPASYVRLVFSVGVGRSILVMGRRKRAITKEAQRNIIKAYEELTVAQLHRAGTLIRAEEIQRWQIDILPLAGRSEGLLASLALPSTLPKLSNTFGQLASALSGDKKTGNLVQAIGKTWEDSSFTLAFVRDATAIVQETNGLLGRIHQKSRYFQPRQFETSFPSLESACVVLCQVIGFLRGIISVKPKDFS